jgi:hypothetical protein
MCKFIFWLSSRLEINEPRCAKQFPQGRIEGHEGKKEEESFWCCCGYFCKIGMLPVLVGIAHSKLLNILWLRHASYQESFRSPI